MTEMRLNLVTRDWVVIATERAKRPADFRRAGDRAFCPPYVETCPFCAGNEHKSPKELFRQADDGAWKIRVVQNKYPAVSDAGDRQRLTEGTKRMVSGVGHHEVIIESPLHDASPAFLDLKYVEDLVRCYRDRFVLAYEDPRVDHVIIFKNHGESSGTSIDHPHSQLIAIPVVPMKFRDRVLAAMHYFDDTGECLICDIIKMEINDGRRIVIDTGDFLTFVPYAAISPFHVWIIPKRHSASFSGITENEIIALARHLKALLLKYHIGLEDPDYNFVIRSSRPADLDNPYSHWYVSVIARISTTAGFELGSGIYYNTGVPEEIAPFLKAIKI